MISPFLKHVQYLQICKKDERELYEWINFVCIVQSYSQQFSCNNILKSYFLINTVHDFLQIVVFETDGGW